MDRTEIILQMCDLKGKGLEFGPSYNPIAPKKDGYDVEILDHLDKEGLINKYKNSGMNIENIEDVDYIWNGEKYSDLTGKKNYYDYIIASHIIEHTCDLIGFLNDCSEMLVDTGILVLAIPDKMYHYDFLRPLTGLARVIDSNVSKNNINTVGSITEAILNACKNNDYIAWDSSSDFNDLRPFHKIGYVRERHKNLLKQNNFIDVHNWVFTKASFELLIYDLGVLDLIDLEIDKCYDTVGCEFFASLKKTAVPVVPDDDKRFHLALRMNSEDTPKMRELTRQNGEFAQQNDELTRKNGELAQKINDLNEQLSNIYNSNTWKVGDKLNKLYRLIIPHRA
jgi:2-polyprenyl-3-methyl-5-hydroxy-6-metoxy-1,4-benzoquinol methylase